MDYPAIKIKPNKWNEKLASITYVININNTVTIGGNRLS